MSLFPVEFVELSKLQADVATFEKVEGTTLPAGATSQLLDDPQRKLIALDLVVIERFSPTVIAYIGSAPGTHFLTTASHYPSIKFVLVETRTPELVCSSLTLLPNVEVITQKGPRGIVDLSRYDVSVVVEDFLPELPMHYSGCPNAQVIKKINPVSAALTIDVPSMVYFQSFAGPGSAELRGFGPTTSMPIADYRKLMASLKNVRSHPYGSTRAGRDSFTTQLFRAQLTTLVPAPLNNVVSVFVEGSQKGVPPDEFRQIVQRLAIAKHIKFDDAVPTDHCHIKAFRRLTHVAIDVFLAEKATRVIEVGPRNRDNAVGQAFKLGRHFVAPVLTLDDSKHTFKPRATQTVCQCELRTGLCKHCPSKATMVAVDVYFSNACEIFEQVVARGGEVFWAVNTYPTGDYMGWRGLEVLRENGRLIVTTDSGDKLYNDVDPLTAVESMHSADWCSIGIHGHCGPYTIFRIGAPTPHQASFSTQNPDFQYLEYDGDTLAAPRYVIDKLKSCHHNLTAVDADGASQILRAANGLMKAEYCPEISFSTAYAAALITTLQLHSPVRENLPAVRSLLRLVGSLKKACAPPTALRILDDFGLTMSSYFDADERLSLQQLVLNSIPLASPLLDRVKQFDTGGCLPLDKLKNFLLSVVPDPSHYETLPPATRDHPKRKLFEHLQPHIVKVRGAKNMGVPTRYTSDVLPRLYSTDADPPEVVDRSDPYSVDSIRGKRLLHPITDPDPPTQHLLRRAANRLTNLILGEAGATGLMPMDFRNGCRDFRRRCGNVGVRPSMIGKLLAILGIVYLTWMPSSNVNLLLPVSIHTSLDPGMTFSNAFWGPLSQQLNPTSLKSLAPAVSVPTLLAKGAMSKKRYLCVTKPWKSISLPGTLLCPSSTSSSLIQSTLDFSPHSAHPGSPLPLQPMPLPNGLTETDVDTPLSEQESVATPTQRLEIPSFTGVITKRFSAAAHGLSIRGWLLTTILRWRAMTASWAYQIDHMISPSIPVVVRMLNRFHDLWLMTLPFAVVSFFLWLLVAWFVLVSIASLVEVSAAFLTHLGLFRAALPPASWRLALYLRSMLHRASLWSSNMPAYCSVPPVTALAGICRQTETWLDGLCWNRASRLLPQWIHGLVSLLPISLTLIYRPRSNLSYAWQLRLLGLRCTVPYLTISQVLTLSAAALIVLLRLFVV